MHVSTILTRWFGNVMHQRRLNALSTVVNSILMQRSLQLTRVGRAIARPIQPRSGIRLVDRLLSNAHLTEQLDELYGILIQQLLKGQTQPIILVDWTKMPNSNDYVLRASLATDSRALTIYEKQFPKAMENHPKAHDEFLAGLARYMPKTCTPILVTDALFKNPWFKRILQYGWHAVGRVRSPHIYYQVDAQQRYEKCINLHAKATATMKCLGDYTLTKKNPLRIWFYLGKQKHIHKPPREHRDKDKRNYSQAHREPWLLVSTLAEQPVQVKQIYQRRMRIEASFRDLKSQRYGLGFEDTCILSQARRVIWLFLAALAHVMAWTLGAMTEARGYHQQFQTNSIHHRRVLSFFYLGCEVIQKRLDIPIPSDIHHLIVEHCLQITIIL